MIQDLLSLSMYIYIYIYAKYITYQCCTDLLILIFARTMLEHSDAGV